jgi:glycosyltransferase involved in cell wall biosynthesis
LDAVRNNLILIFRLRRTLRKCNADCIIAFQETANIRAFLATLGMRAPVVMRVEDWPPQFLKYYPRWRHIRSRIYPRARAIVVQTERIRDCFSERAREKIRIIANPINIDYLESPPLEIGLPGKKNIVTVARLHPKKRLDLLIRAFAAIAGKIDCGLVVIGDGPERGRLESLCHSLGVAEKVRFTGVLTNPWSLAGNCDIFVLSSEYEGMPNALLEAMACGLAVISFDCPTGPRELIRHGHNGVLVPLLDLDALTREMERLLRDDEERKRLGRAAQKVRDTFSLETVMQQWETVLEQVLRKN